MSSRGRALVWAAVIAIGAVAMSVAPFLTWVAASVVAGPERVLGTLDAGQTGFDTTVPVWIALLAGVVALVAAAAVAAGRFRGGARLGGLAAAVGAVIAWLGYRYAENPETFVFPRDDSPVVLSTGPGLWVLLGGAAVVLAGSIAAGFLARPPESR